MRRYRFKVTGLALVPVQVSMSIYGENNADAMQRASAIWKENPKVRRDCIVVNSEDHCSVFDFQPSQAERVKITAEVRKRY